MPRIARRIDPRNFVEVVSLLLDDNRFVFGFLGYHSVFLQDFQVFTKRKKVSLAKGFETP